jgi:tRNA dimethylallyltransferase
LPILCGGSGFYIQAVVDDMAFPDVPPNKELRKKLRKRSTESLYKELKAKDPRRAEEIDENNPVRLIRALEIIDELGEVPKLEKQERFDTLQIGLDRADKDLKQRIIARTKKRLENGMIEEAQELQKNGLSLRRLRDLGLEYKHLAEFLEDKISKQKLFENILRSDWQYAKKQRTWFQKDDRIQWFHPESDKKEIMKQAEELSK